MSHVSREQKFDIDVDDNELVVFALKGDRKALEFLIGRHQRRIYNIAVRMLLNPQDAEDVTQEILVKMTTRLSTFKPEKGTKFRTWLYKVAYHHIINEIKNKTGYEKKVNNFSTYGQAIDNTPMVPFSEREERTQEEVLLIEEAKNMCMTAMLLCLNRKKRMAFILGDIFNIKSSESSEIMEMAPSNYRQTLLRARKQISEFILKKCSLMDKTNRCYCTGKVKPYITLGEINPSNLKFSGIGLKKLNDVIEEKANDFVNFIEEDVARLYRNQPFYKSPDFLNRIQTLLDSKKFGNLFSIPDIRR